MYNKIPMVDEFKPFKAQRLSRSGTIVNNIAINAIIKKKKSVFKMSETNKGKNGRITKAANII